MKKTDTRVQYTKHVLKNALLEILSEKPIDKVTVKELCDRAGLNRGTFYLHYSSPRDLLSEMETEFVAELMVHFNSYWQANREYSFMEKLFTAIYEHRDMWRVLLGPNGDPGFMQQVTAHARENIIAEWGAEFPDYSAEDLNFVFDYVFPGAAGITSRWLSGEIDMDAKSVARRMERLGHHSLMAAADFRH